jgi:hypothetical protein
MKMRWLVLSVAVAALVSSCGSSSKQPLHCCMIDMMCEKCPARYCDSSWTPYRHSSDEALCASFIADSFNCSLGPDLSGPYYYATDAKAACLAE